MNIAAAIVCSQYNMISFSGNIPAYSTTNAHVIQTNVKLKRDVSDSDTMYYTIQTDDEVMNVELHPNKNLLSK